MATNVTINSAYAGQFAGEYIAPALLEANTIAQGGVEVKQNIKLKSTLKRASLSGIISDASCDFEAGGVLTLEDRVLQPKELKVNVELCKSVFQDDWEAEAMGFSAHDQLPPKFADWMIAYVAGQVAEATEVDLWQGQDVADHFLGLVPQMLADASTTKLAGAVLDKSNIQDALSDVLRATNKKLIGKPDFHLYISPEAKFAYIDALGGFGAAGLGSNGVDAKGNMWYNGGPLSFGGVKIFVAEGLGANTIVSSQKSNLYFGTGLLNDYNEVKLIDMSETVGSDMIRVIMKYTAGTQYGFGSEIVVFDPSVL